jgi:transposase
MGGNHEKGMYNQLMVVMACLDAMEDSLCCEKREHKKDVDRLNKKIDSLTQENRLLKDDNARLRSIINNGSSNTSLPPSTDQKGGKPANTFNGRKKTERKAGGQKSHAGTTLTKSDIEEKIATGRCRHEIRTIDKVSGQNYVTKYVADLNVELVITEIRIFADENGKFSIPEQYRRCAGILVHDHETALYHFGTDHAECNVHIIRYLRKNTEETGNQWSDKMISLLVGMNKQRKGLMA